MCGTPLTDSAVARTPLPERGTADRLFHGDRGAKIRVSKDHTLRISRGGEKAIGNQLAILTDPSNVRLEASPVVIEGWIAVSATRVVGMQSGFGHEANTQSIGIRSANLNSAR